MLVLLEFQCLRLREFVLLEACIDMWSFYLEEKMLDYLFVSVEIIIPKELKVSVGKL